MSETKVFTVEEVSKYSEQKECYVIIGDKVYNASNFIDEHPGGIEVILDVGGQDASEAFEDVGHSDEAREILKTLEIGKVDKPASATPNVATKKPVTWTPDQQSSGMGATTYIFVAVGVVVAFLAYQFLVQGKA